MTMMEYRDCMSSKTTGKFCLHSIGSSGPALIQKPCRGKFPPGPAGGNAIWPGAMYVAVGVSVLRRRAVDGCAV